MQVPPIYTLLIWTILAFAVLYVTLHRILEEISFQNDHHDDILQKLHDMDEEDLFEYNYRCPNCGGEFEEWEESKVDERKKYCPFCGNMKGDY